MLPGSTLEGASPFRRAAAYSQRDVNARRARRRSCLSQLQAGVEPRGPGHDCQATNVDFGTLLSVAETSQSKLGSAACGAGSVLRSLGVYAESSPQGGDVWQSGTAQLHFRESS